MDKITFCLPLPKLSILTSSEWFTTKWMWSAGLDGTSPQSQCDKASVFMCFSPQYETWNRSKQRLNGRDDSGLDEAEHRGLIPVTTSTPSSLFIIPTLFLHFHLTISHLELCVIGAPALQQRRGGAADGGGERAGRVWSVLRPVPTWMPASQRSAFRSFFQDSA